MTVVSDEVHSMGLWSGNAQLASRWKAFQQVIQQYMVFKPNIFFITTQVRMLESRARTCAHTHTHTHTHFLAVSLSMGNCLGNVTSVMSSSN